MINEKLVVFGSVVDLGKRPLDLRSSRGLVY
jgi:hypothetical protein